MTTQEFQLNACLNIKARICNDSIGYVKEQDVKRIVAKWITDEIGLPPIQNTIPAQIEVSRHHVVRSGSTAAA